MESIIYTDFDEFREINSELDGQWMSYGKRCFHWKAETVALGNSLIIRGHSQTGLITEGIALDDFFHFYVPFGNGWRNNGIPFGQEEILILEPGAVYHTTTKTPDGYCGILIPKNMITLSETDRKQVRNSYTVKAELISEQIRNLIQQYIAAVQKNADIEFSLAAKLIENELKSILVPLLGEHQAPKNAIGRNRISRLQVIKQTNAIMEEFDNKQLNIAQLTTKLDVSERTLLTIFQEYYKIGPHQYLQLRLLHQVYKDLLSADPEQTMVTDVLISWGVWEFGRFALRYKRQFGESPKQTLFRKL